MSEAEKNNESKYRYWYNETELLILLCNDYRGRYHCQSCCHYFFCERNITKAKHLSMVVLQQYEFFGFAFYCCGRFIKNCEY